MSQTDHQVDQPTSEGSTSFTPEGSAVPAADQTEWIRDCWSQTRECWSTLRLRERLVQADKVLSEERRSKPQQIYRFKLQNLLSVFSLQTRMVMLSVISTGVGRLMRGGFRRAVKGVGITFVAGGIFLVPEVFNPFFKHD